MTHETTHPRTALITGASRGLGRALAQRLHQLGWQVIADARSRGALSELARSNPGLIAIPGDLTDSKHRQALADTVANLGSLDLLVNNAGGLGPSPLPPLARYPGEALRALLDVNVLAPLAMTQLLLPRLRAVRGIVVNLTSDAAVEPYDGWGGYGASKAALDQLGAVLGVEEPTLAVYAFDPGDMRTEMHQQAFVGQDISDRPDPDTVVPALLHVVQTRPPSGRYRAADLTATVAR